MVPYLTNVTWGLLVGRTRGIDQMFLNVGGIKQDLQAYNSTETYTPLYTVTLVLLLRFLYRIEYIFRKASKCCRGKSNMMRNLLCQITTDMWTCSWGCNLLQDISFLGITLQPSTIVAITHNIQLSLKARREMTDERCIINILKPKNIVGLWQCPEVAEIEYHRGIPYTSQTEHLDCHRCHENHWTSQESVQNSVRLQPLYGRIPTEAA